jgi:hypothetical protein
VVGSGAGAVIRRKLLGCIRRFRLRDRLGVSSSEDPLYRFHQWQANLRILMVQEIKTVPDVPLSHPFVERLSGTHPAGFLGPNVIVGSG